MLPEMLIPMSFFAMIFGIVYLVVSTRNKERLALIEKGADASIFATKKEHAAPVWKILILTMALMMIGIGTGIFIANMLLSVGVDEDVAFPGTIFLCSGIGLLTAFFMIKRMNEIEEDKMGSM